MLNEKNMPNVDRGQRHLRGHGDAPAPCGASQVSCTESVTVDSARADELERRHARAAELVADALIAMLVSERLAEATRDAPPDAHAQTMSDRNALDEAPRPMAVSTSRDERARRRGNP